MGKSVYVTTLEGYSGKSAVALGLLDALSRRVQRVGVFRPIVLGDAATGDPGQRDYVLDLLVAHEAVTLGYDECTGVTYDDVHADPVAALDTIVERYHRVADQCDAVVIVGSDYTDVGSPTEFAYNARVAANLSAPVLLVVNGADRSPDDVKVLADMAAGAIAENHASLFAVVANRVTDPDLSGVVRALARDGVPVYALPEEPLLSAPTLADLLPVCGGRLVSGDPALLDREVLGVMVAGMTMPNVLDRLFDGVVVVTPGDRPEVVLGVLMAHLSAGFPQVSGIVLNGGIELPSQVTRLLESAGATLPIIATDLGTQETSTALTSMRGRLRSGSGRKVAAALSLFAQHIDSDALLDGLDVARTTAVTPLMFEHQLIDMASADRRHIVLPEGDEPRVLAAADLLLRRGVADLTLLGDPIRITAQAASCGADITGATLLDPETSELTERFAEEYYQRRRHRGIDRVEARTAAVDVSYFGTLMVELGLADGMVSGAAHTTAHTIRPALEVVKTVPGVSVVSSVFFMCLQNQVLVYGDCAVNPDPTAEQLADIAVSSAATASAFGIEPRVAMLSYSTGSSGAGSDVEKVSAATELVRARAPHLLVEGPIQYDAAIDPSVAATKLPGSQVAGQATVFVFPDLNTGNNTYKAVQRSAGAVAIGPVLQGLRKPVNDLSRGATVRDIVNTVAITAIQAQQLDQQLDQQVGQQLDQPVDQRAGHPEPEAVR
ncbi:phosphate acetyltransferase [Nocardioides ferulae]|uniref:phosphate acetyltransferase n=1 Tax=Nocardioides ferulae TaxID=2340821 RepID=UPI000EB1088A|nr:phosphate acetyltransferase [Nocardioides ferulae]